mmetsp:Transcript_21122/g.39875  ORF Transcript_21122/g.39875 Transcript_21122/m.39875 type:complete len:202 (+) Transcript_21122:691-1296(+)
MESITNHRLGRRDCSRPHVVVNSIDSNSPRIPQCNQQRRHEETKTNLPTNRIIHHPELIIPTHQRSITLLLLPAPRTSQVHPSQVQTVPRTRYAGVLRTIRRDYPPPSLACCCRRSRSRPCRSIPIRARAVSRSGWDTVSATGLRLTVIVINPLQTKVVTIVISNNNRDGKGGSAVAALAVRVLPRRNSSICPTSTAAMVL